MITVDEVSARANAPLHALDTAFSCPGPGCADNRLTRAGGSGLLCESCGQRFPIFDAHGVKIPWLFADPARALNEWRMRYAGFLEQTWREIQAIAADLRQSPTPAAESRLRDMDRAKRRYIEQVRSLLAPFGLAKRALSRDSRELPRKQSLTGYIDTVFRDWHWRTGEVENLFKPVRQLVQKHRVSAQRMVTLGAGAGRFCDDLACLLDPEMSVHFDINPLLSAIAAQVFNGHRVQLYEFPIAPLGGNDQAILRSCARPRRTRTPPATQFVCGDVMRPPWPSGSFDLVFTPWLIDILEHPLTMLLPRLNHLLEVGGTWINSGSLAFEQTQPAANYTRSEIADLLADYGFEMVDARDDRLGFMQSPQSAHGRVERVFSFVVRKIGPPRRAIQVGYDPAWLDDPHVPIPHNKDFEVHSADHMLKAQVLAAVDGQRCAAQIAAALAAQYQIDQEDALQAVKTILAVHC